ncbi:hypothetical protein DZF91_12660 [Actinomadura logoneensis]|uniref:DUF6458 domain-containing protein n=1 Tax=Actinomadura logoneensis TaxID=2293572 RepID=A0A372JMM4_9ACTN|nr:DUF6458 family protein [Actinomadura logoneensis]RFU41271.1 hypothetical protein DZF91_12660 [Actinomadura logoneensis]
MTIGGSIALIIIGAILSYAVDYQFSGVDIRVVGIILMLGGLLGLVIGIVRIASARRRPVAPPPTVREERYYEDPELRRRY